MSDDDNVVQMHIPSAHLECPQCGEAWWRATAITIDKRTGSATGYGYPVNCTQCGYSLPPSSPA